MRLDNHGARSPMTSLWRDQAGNTMVMTAAAILPLLAMIGGAVDASRIYLVQSRLQSACDAGALASRRAMAGGAQGVISVASNVVPRTFARLCALARAGQGGAAADLDARLQDLYDFLGVEPNPIPVKALLARQGLGHGLRLPLQPLSSPHAALADEMAALCRQVEQELA